MLESAKGWRFALLLLYFISFLAIIVGLVSALISEIRRRSKLEVSLQQAELISLKAQIQPHFLFNTLNTIKALVREDPVKADQTIQHLSDLYHYILKSSDSAFSTLKDEIENVEKYLAIEKIRFCEKLTFTIEIDPDWMTYRVPSLILQPLVENAVKHGISPKIESGRVTIKSLINKGQKTLCISDDGLGFSLGQANGKGIGLKNVKERWLLFSGKPVRIESQNDEGTQLYLEFPDSSVGL